MDREAPGTEPDFRRFLGQDLPLDGKKGFFPRHRAAD